MPSFNDVIAGSSADSSCIQQVVDALKGTAGKGVPISITAVSDAANWAVDVKNNEAVNSRGYRVSRANGTVLIQADVNGVQVSSTGGAPATAVNVSDVQTLTNKTTSLLAASGNVVQVPQCRLSAASSQTIVTGTLTHLNFDTETWDNDSLHSTAVNSSRITPSRAGLWMWGAQVIMDANSSGTVNLALTINGGQACQTQVPNSVLGPMLLAQTEYQCSTTDWLGVAVIHSRGANLGTVAGTALVWAHYVGTT